MNAPTGRIGAWGYRLVLLILRGWWVIRRPRSAGVRCVLRHGLAFVLVRHTYGDGGWMLPGGRLRQGEDPVRGAAREMAQELGVKVPRVAPGWIPGCACELLAPLAAGVNTAATGPTTSRRKSNRPVLHRRPAEVCEVGWFKLDELLRIARRQSISRSRTPGST